MHQPYQTSSRPLAAILGASGAVGFAGAAVNGGETDRNCRYRSLSTQLALYESLPAASGKKLERCGVAIDKAKAKGVALIFEIGEQLRIAQDELANQGDGTFVKWCKERCGLSTSTAYRYLDVVDAFASQKILDFPSLGKSFTAEALYYLSRDTTPDDAIADALKAAKKGQRITLGKAAEIVSQYTVTKTADRCRFEPRAACRAERGTPLVRAADRRAVGEGCEGRAYRQATFSRERRFDSLPQRPAQIPPVSASQAARGPVDSRRASSRGRGSTGRGRRKIRKPFPN